MIFLFLYKTVQAQNIPDSVITKLNTAANDSVKVIALLEAGESIEETAPEKSMVYYKQALALSKQIKNNRLILSSYNDVGVCYINLNKMDSAVVFLEQAVPVAKLLNDNVRVARVLANIGNVYLHMKDRAKAIEYYLQSARIWETCSDQNYLPLLYSNINALLNEQKEYNKALEYGNKSLLLSQKLGDGYSVVNALVNLANTYGYLEQPEKEYELLEKALPLAKKNEALDQIATVYHDMGDYYFEKKDYAASLEKYLESFNYVKQMGNRYHLCTACAALALVYHRLNQHDKALQYILEAEKVANEVGARADLKEIYTTRAEIEQQAGNYKIASEYFSKILVLSDSLFKAETSERVAEAEAKYQNEKKQKEIIQLQKEKELQSLAIKQKSMINYFLIGSLIVFIAVGFLIYRNFRHRQLLAKQQDELQQQKIRELEKDKQLLAVDSILKGQEEERSRLAKDLHDGLGGLLSGVKYSLINMKDNMIMTGENLTVFERSLDMIDNSIRELRRVAQNMMPEALLKLGLDNALKDYCNAINTSGILQVTYQSFGMKARMESNTEIIIYRIIQELLNNIMKHAATDEAFVQLVQGEGHLHITVEDNGKGFDTADLQNSKGAGWANIQSRVDYLKGKLDLQSNPGKGTGVNIEFNL
ncbi:ATP-binding protein [soil metagenome]